MIHISRKILLRISALFCCVAVINACATTNFLFRVTVENFHAVVIFENLTLRCDPSSVLNSTVVQITYQWHRVGGSIPEKSIGNESRELTIPRVVPEDEGLYYCMGFHFGHCAVSNNATVIVDDLLAISVSSDRSLINKGGTVQFTATASGVGTLEYQWRMIGVDKLPDKVSGEDTLVLTIPNINKSDEGWYYCIVTNIWSRSVESNHVILTIYGPPNITTHPSSRLVNINTSITLDCDASGEEPITFWWDNSDFNGRQWTNISNSNSRKLVVKELEWSERFRCVASNNAGETRSNTANIAVLRIITHPQNKILELNSTISFRCTASISSNVTFSWTHNGRSINGSSTTGDTSILTITSVKHSDAGCYVCTVRSGSLSVMSNAAILAPIDVSIPIIITHPTDKVTNASESVTLNCKGIGRGSITYQWETSNIIGGQWMYISNSNSKTLVVGTLEQSQQYRCVVSNEAGSTRSNVATVSVLSHPRLLDHPAGGEIPLTGSITLTCSASGIGTLVYSWERSSNSSWTTVSNDNTTSYTTDATLAIGQYMYRCRVSNEAGSVVSNIATVNVYGPPAIINPLTDQVIEFNEGTTLNCTANGDGTITYQWQEFSNGSWMDINNGNNVEYTTDRLTQSSQFRCVVTNEAGITTSNVTILVLDITTHPEDKLVSVNSTVSLTCTSSVSSNAIFSWTHNGRSINGSSTTGGTSILTITRVRHSDAGSYVCTVRSESLSVMSNAATLTVYGIPTITDHPTKDNVIVGRSITLSCRAGGVGTLAYSWERSSGSDWTTVSNDNTTSYTTDTTLAIGQYMYRCRVSNEVGSVVSNIATVNVYGPPTIKTHPASQLTTVNVKVILQCKGTGRGSITYQWETSNIIGRQWMNISHSNSKRLVVRNLEHSQQYRCVVSNKVGSVRSDVATITVLRITIQPVNSITVVILENITLHCSASIDGVTYSWHRVDGHIPSRSLGQYSDTLTIHRVTPHDEGMYYCIASKSEISVQSNNASVQVDDQLAISIISNHSLVNKGGTVQFTATASGIETLSYQWRKRGVDKLPDKVLGEDTSVLKIPNIDKSDEGQYYCIVTNMWNRRMESNHVNLTIFGPPIITTHPSSQLVTSNMIVILHCNANGKGLVTFKWENTNTNRGQWMTISNSDSRKLVVKNLEHSEQKFRCVASNDAGQTRSNVANITILKIITHPQNKLLELNSTISFRCTASISYNVIFSWTHNGTSINGSSTTGDTSILTITSVRQSDAGSYVCIVRCGSLSVVSNTAILAAVVSAPSITHQPDDVNITVYKSASFSCVAHGFGLIQIVWKRVNYGLPITADVTEERSLNGLSSTLKIINIVGYYSGQYYCVAENEVGKITSQTVNLHVQIDRPEIIIPPVNITVIPNDSFNLNCLALSSGVLTYNWSKHDGNLPQTAVKSYIHETFLNSLGGTATLVYNLAVHNVTVSDEGWYCCIATNEGGTTIKCAWLEVNTLPNITMQPASKAVRKGELNVIAMSCEVVGMGPIYFKWEKYHTVDNSWIMPSHRAVNISSPTLEFSVIKEEDEGVYHCIITNDDGSVISDNATIFVYGPPIITFISNYTVSLEGDKVTLLCIAINDVHATYSLQINWYKGNKLITPNSKHIIFHNEVDKTTRQLKSILLFDPINHADDGEYTCQASNHPDSYSELKTNLTVEYAPHVSIVNRSPYITNVGSVGVLYCKASGKPIPIVQWYKGGFPINPIPLYFQQVLLVPTDTPHSTVYTCVGINYAGNKKHMRFANITVIVEDFKPCHPLLEAPENGERTIIRIDGFAKHISFRCNSGYALIGDSLATCNNGMWSSAAPTCKKQH